MSNLIALYSAGPQMGKTSVSNYLVQYHGYTNVKFAGALKSMVYTMLRQFKDDPDWAYACIEGDQKEVPLKWLGGRTPRQLMVTLGTDWGRNLIDPNIWVTAGYAQVKRLLKAGKNVVVDDMRFPNEYRVLQNLQAQMVGVSVTGEAPPARVATEGLLNDFSFSAYLCAKRGDVSGLMKGAQNLAYRIEMGDL